VRLGDDLFDGRVAELAAAARGQDVHAEGGGTALDSVADAAVADDPDGSPLQPLDVVRLPASRVLVADQPAQIFREPEHGCDGELAEGVGVEAARIRDHHIAAAQQIEGQRLHARRQRMNPTDVAELAPQRGQDRGVPRRDQHGIHADGFAAQGVDVGADCQLDVRRFPPKHVERGELGWRDDKEAHEVCDSQHAMIAIVHAAIPEQLNLQDVSGEAKPYQIRQFLRLVERYDLRMKGDS
jgi:hypothetical protein